MTAHLTDDSGRPSKRVWLFPALVIGGTILIIAIVGVAVVLLNYEPPPELPVTQSLQ